MEQLKDDEPEVNRLRGDVFPSTFRPGGAGDGRRRAALLLGGPRIPEVGQKPGVLPHLLLVASLRFTTGHLIWYPHTPRCFEVPHIAFLL